MSQGTQAVSEQWIDISLGLHDGMVHWPDNPPVQIGFVMAIDKGDVCNVSKMSMGVHSGTLYWLLSTSVREKGHLAMIPILFLSVRWDSAIDRGGESFSFTRETTGAMNSRS